MAGSDPWRARAYIKVITVAGYALASHGAAQYAMVWCSEV